MEAAARNFFASKYFAVAGASQDTAKFGYIVFEWYHDHHLQVVPMTPSRPNIKVDTFSYMTTPSPSTLRNPQDTSLSIVTQPPITRQILQAAKEVGVRAVWLQPGSFDAEGLELAKRLFGEMGVVGGMGKGTRGGEGWCVLVDGDKALQGAAREEAARLKQEGRL